MRRFVIVFCFLLIHLAHVFSTTYRTEPIEGSDTFVPDEIMDTVSGIEFRITWDATAFYFSILGGFDLDLNEDWWVYIDVNQTDGLGATAAPAPSPVTFDMTAGTSYEPEYAVFIEDGTTAVFFTWTGAAWDGGTPLPSPHASVPGYAEFALPFGLLVPIVPHDGFCVASDVENDNNSFIISAYPVENPLGAGGNILPDINWFYQFYMPHVPGLMPVPGYSPMLVDHSLPVFLTSFNATGRDNNVLLSWVTEAEIDNEAFIIERRVDDDERIMLTELEGGGTTNEKQTYTFVDHNVINGRTYSYRLADRDVNGNISYHGEISATPMGEEKIKLVDSSNPRIYMLHQNYPNPFNPSTSIEFELPSNQIGYHELKINIFDAQGRKVKSLVNGDYAPGTYQVSWNGTNDRGELISTGIYFYVLSTSHISLSKKMIYIR